MVVVVFVVVVVVVVLMVVVVVVLMMAMVVVLVVQDMAFRNAIREQSFNTLGPKRFLQNFHNLPLPVLNSSLKQQLLYLL